MAKEILKVDDIVLFGDDLLTVATIYNNGEVVLVDDDGNEVRTTVDKVCAQNDFDPPPVDDDEPVNIDVDEDEPETEPEDVDIDGDEPETEPDEPETEPDEPETEPDGLMEQRMFKMARAIKKLYERIDSLEKRLIQYECLPEPPKPKKGMEVKALYEGEWLDSVIIGKSRKTGLWIVEDEEGSWEVTEQEMQLPEPTFRKKTRRKANTNTGNGADEMTPAQKRVARIEKLGLSEGDKIVVKDGGKKRRAVVEKLYTGNSKFKGYVRAVVNGEAVKLDPAKIVKVL